MKRMVIAVVVGLMVCAAPLSAGEKTKKKLLVITESKGFVHSVVNRGKNDKCLVEKTFLELAEKHPFFEVEYTQDSHVTPSPPKT